jgi:tRNA(Ile)-lysidine synthase
LQPRVLESIRRCGLWAPGETVAVAVSGGVDSLVLLHLLHRTVSAHGGTLTVLSADHGLRKESAAEVEGVRAVAQSLDIPFVGVRLNIEPGPNLAERARDARKEALLGLGTDRIATGHHEDDQAETVLYHLLRGSGMRGLRGMQPRDGQWVRPLLFESRAVIQTWAEADGLSWVEDPSNPHSQRGQLRRLMPLLDEVHGGAGRALARSARLLAREDALLVGLGDEAWIAASSGDGLSRDGLASMHPALQLRLLRRLVGQLPVRAGTLEAVIEGALLDGGRLDLGGGACLVSKDGVLLVEGPC